MEIMIISFFDSYSCKELYREGLETIFSVIYTFNVLFLQLTEILFNILN